MAQVTKLELTQLLAAANARVLELTEQLSIMTAERDMFARTAHNAIARNDGVDPVSGAKAKPAYTPIRRRPVYEFKQGVPGDFQRAQELARKNNGIVVRALT